MSESNTPKSLNQLAEHAIETAFEKRLMEKESPTPEMVLSAKNLLTAYVLRSLLPSRQKRLDLKIPTLEETLESEFKLSAHNYRFSSDSQLREFISTVRSNLEQSAKLIACKTR